MKGKLKRIKDGYWDILYTIPHPKVMVKEWNASIPLHPDNVADVEQHIEATKITHNLLPNMEIDFEMCIVVDHDSGKGIQYGKIVDKDKQRGILVG